MKEFTLGSVDHDELHVRLFRPLSVWRAIWRRENYHWHWKIRRGVTHRCYCNAGWLWDWSLVFAGWQIQWFFSRYTGPRPCCCDEVVDAALERLESEAHR